MSFFNNYDRDQIYNEMEGKSSGSSGGIVAKTLSIVLLISLGFASGSIFSAYQNSKTSGSSGNIPVIQTSSNNSGTAYTISHTDVSGIVTKCADSVVEIGIEAQTSLGYYTYTQQGNGSGVIISSDGYILTNNHVISGANKITVTLRNGTNYEATLVGTDSKTDIAIIKIDANNLTVANIGDSDKLVVGELAVAIGNPLGQLGGTVTDGIISALEREITIDSKKMNLIQTNAAINPGNSGGGLFNANGDLIGVVVAKSSGFDVEGLGFAIPVNDVKDVINDILQHGYATNRPFLGVSMKDTSYSNGNDSFYSFFFQQVSYGALVDEVTKDSPAEKAGIQKNDIIISINNEVVSSASEVSTKISTFNVGDKVTIGLIRDGKTLNVEATLEEYKGQQ